MTDSTGLTSVVPGAGPRAGQAPVSQASDSKDINKEFEKLLWAEMLSHAGLEKAFTQSGGEAAASFSRMIVESIAEDLAERHPLGFDPVATGPKQTAQATRGGPTE